MSILSFITRCATCSAVFRCRRRFFCFMMRIRCRLPRHFATSPMLSLSMLPRFIADALRHVTRFRFSMLRFAYATSRDGIDINAVTATQHEARAARRYVDVAARYAIHARYMLCYHPEPRHRRRHRSQPTCRQEYVAVGSGRQAAAGRRAGRQMGSLPPARPPFSRYFFFRFLLGEPNVCPRDTNTSQRTAAFSLECLLRAACRAKYRLLSARARTVAY